MTIKERARIAFERDLEVVVIEKGCISHEGHIGAYHTGSAGVEVHYPPDDGGETFEEKRIWYKDIIEIRFVEEEAEVESDNTCTHFNCAHRIGCDKPESKQCHQSLAPYILKERDGFIDVEILDKRPISEKTDPLNERVRVATVRMRGISEQLARQIADNIGKQACPEPPDDEESPIMVALQDAFENRKKVAVRYSCTTEEHEYTGYVKEIRLRKRKPFIDPVICLGDKEDIHATMCLSAIEEVTILADDIAKQRWFAGEDDLAGTDIHDLMGNHIATVWADGDFAKVMAAAPEMLDALRMVVNGSTISRIQNGTHDSDTITVKFNPDGWRIITEALNKAEIK